MIVATLDGVLHPSDQPLLRPDDVGVLRGDGVFETTLVVDGVPRDLEEHLARLAVSATMIDLQLPADDEWRRGIDAVLQAWTPLPDRQMVLRLIATRGPEHADVPTCYVTGGPLPEATCAQRDGVRIRVLPRGFAGREIVVMPWLLPGAKTLSYAINMAAIRHAKSLGDQDVVFVGTDGTVLEGPTATVVLAVGDTLTTPPRDGILDGITVRRLFAAAEKAGWTTRRAEFETERLLSAGGAYLLSSARILAPIVSVDGTARPIGPRTAELAALLELPGAPNGR
ncbi:aminotransferase class IV [Nakamurella lactea]|uniref:aminotransferase class IV n=1 Tax=Nakamurella lactea TaxID=459515 RepID=UPI000406BBF9|nr:aminotransferase class IV [Nakamurella lactea]